LAWGGLLGPGHIWTKGRGVKVAQAGLKGYLQHFTTISQGIETMSEGLRTKISDELKTAMKAGDKLKVSTLRLVGAAIKDRDIQNRTAGPDSGVSDAQIIDVLAKMVKQRQESVAMYQQGGRPELAQQESTEIDIIQSFMPKQLSEAEVKSVVAAIIQEVGAQSVKDMGKVMAALKAKYAGQMDMAKAGGVVKGLLGS
jgi:uncharacterized protein